jgi:type VI protein secretion system component Hcp
MAIGDNFMWIPDGGPVAIEGESTDTYFKTVKAFEIDKFSFNVKNSDQIGDGGKFQECTVDKLMDSASVPFYRVCSKGLMIPTLMMAVRKASGGGGLLYIQYIFRGNYITGLTWEGGGGGGATEKMTFSFKAMGLQYIAQLQDGRQGKRQAWSWSSADEEKGSAGSATLDIPVGPKDPPCPPAPPFLTGHTRDLKH